MFALAAAACWLMFVAELGDKTLFAVLLLSSRYPPWRVFAGAAMAFALHGLIAVGLGQIIGSLPHGIIRYGSAALFLWFGLVLLFKKGEAGAGGSLESGATRPALTSFLLVFAAEWGDATQILSAALVANNLARLGRLRASVAVFTGGLTGLWLGTALAAVVGHRAGRWLPEGPLRKVAGACFLVVAFATAFIQR